MDINDIRGTKYARTAFSKRGIDISNADVRVQHGICFVRGLLKPMPRWNINSVKAECEHIASIIRRSEVVKDVVLECTYKEDYFKK
ncbi:MAG: hypothetical protein HYR64_09050 [Fimbriimonas ginsengisoli]|uniref:Uncharacterized protein n=1 Tax=Fimbriimonas ginsengisoli TaxID=1005039 RepID=A0A931LTL2_FIMGI|nr:hypothetical protein [Fimbriimonas ginsengisoli]